MVSGPDCFYRLNCAGTDCTGSDSMGPDCEGMDRTLSKDNNFEKNACFIQVYM